MLDPPARLRAAVLSSAAVRRAARQRQWHRLRPRAGFVLPAAALLILAIGLAGWGAVQQRQLAAAQAALVIDGQGLALLTSTETTLERLGPVPPIGGQAHGHWYHRSGIQTQVLVVEFMPPPPPGQAYFGWLLRANGSAQPAGRFTLDSQGYGRLILLGGDGSDVRSVEVTRQPVAAAAAPGGQVVLRWPAG